MKSVQTVGGEMTCRDETTTRLNETNFIPNRLSTIVHPLVCVVEFLWKIENQFKVKLLLPYSILILALTHVRRKNFDRSYFGFYCPKENSKRGISGNRMNRYTHVYYIKQLKFIMGLFSQVIIVYKSCVG